MLKKRRQEDDREVSKAKLTWVSFKNGMEKDINRICFAR